MTHTTITTTITCTDCGKAATVTPLGWVSDIDTTTPDRRVRYYCAACARTHLPAIEAGLRP